MFKTYVKYAPRYKTCISVSNEYSQSFACNSGVRQGENLSTVLFSLYLNELENHLINYNCTGVVPTLDEQNNFLEIGMHLLCLLYADDTALLATNSDGLQNKYLTLYLPMMHWGNINLTPSI